MTDEELKPFIGKKVIIDGANGVEIGVLQMTNDNDYGLKWYVLARTRNVYTAEYFESIEEEPEEEPKEKPEKEPKKPPLGLRPKFVVNEQRRAEIIAAVQRYGEAGVKIPQKWIDEYNSLCEVLK